MRKRLIHIVLILTAVLLVAIFGYKSFYKSFYPIKYSEFVEKYSAQYNLEPNVLYAVIKTESGFKPDAVSSVGARGLTQITESTYSWLVKYKGLESESFDDMFDPEKNIMFSACLLGYYFDIFSDISAVMSAYHAGMNITKEWLKNSNYSDDGISLYFVPYPDTNKYITSVTKNLATYNKLYS